MILLSTRTTARKHLSERRDYALDFAAEPEMVAGETITSVRSVTSDPDDGLTIGAPTHDDTKAQATIEGGRPGVVYRVRFTIETDRGHVLVGHGLLRVIPD